MFNVLQDEKELCLATAQFEDFVLQFMDRYVCVWSFLDKYSHYSIILQALEL